MVIGVTGGIACGKSEVCRILERLGFLHIDADQAAHEVLTWPEVIAILRAEFGDGILFAQSEYKTPTINRGALSAIVFSDPEKMKFLEETTRPRIVSYIKDFIRNHPQNNVVVEGIALISTGIYKEFNEVWVVRVDKETQIRRLIEKRNMSREDAEKRLASQEKHDWDDITPDREINSSVPLEEMTEAVEAAAEDCLKKHMD